MREPRDRLSLPNCGISARLHVKRESPGCDKWRGVEDVASFANARDRAFCLAEARSSCQIEDAVRALPASGLCREKITGAVHRTFSARTHFVHLISRKQEDGSRVSVVLSKPSQVFVSTDVGSCRRSGEATDCQLCTIWFLDGALDATRILYRLLV
jgi:hypothetical protein